MSTAAAFPDVPPLVETATFGVSVRPLTPDDFAFTEALYASTRAAEIALAGWPSEQGAAFLRQQHQLQHAHYQAQYPTAAWLVIERAGKPIGRLYLAVFADQVRIIDIALVAAARGAGLGGALLRDIGRWAATLARPVTAHVEKNNPAQRLYRRIGFAMAEEKEVYDLLRWHPA